MIEESSLQFRVRVTKPECTGGGTGSVHLEHPVGVDSVCITFDTPLWIPERIRDGESQRAIALSPDGVRGLRDLLTAYLLARKELNQ
jgi:hypothetical protein